MHISALCRFVVPETASFPILLDHLDDRADGFFGSLRNNKGTLIDYGKRYRADKPVSTAMAEPAIDEVIGARMCKRRQMRCAVIDGDLASGLRRWSSLPPQSSIHIVLTEATIAQIPPFFYSPDPA